MLLGVQILGLLFGLFMMYYTFLNFKRKEINRTEFLFWIIIWVLFSFLSLFPKSIDFLTYTLNLYRTLDLLTIFGFIFLIGLTYFNYFIAKKNQKKIEYVVRKVAINKVRK